MILFDTFGVFTGSLHQTPWLETVQNARLKPYVPFHLLIYYDLHLLYDLDTLYRATVTCCRA